MKYFINIAGKHGWKEYLLPVDTSVVFNIPINTVDGHTITFHIQN